MRTRFLFLLAATASAVVWSTPAASGAGPSPGVSQGGAGLRSGDVRYVASLAGGSTLVQATDRDGHALHQLTVRGSWGLPLVAYDNTVEGLVNGGRNLLLAQQIYTGDGQLRKPTTFKLLDARTLKVRRVIRLAGTFSFDAASPDGRYVYLVEYFSTEDPTLYRVRAYDLREGRLLAKIVSDRRSWQTGMQGMPISRTWKDGWAVHPRAEHPRARSRLYRHALAWIAAADLRLPAAHRRRRPARRPRTARTCTRRRRPEELQDPQHRQEPVVAHSCHSHVRFPDVT
jgi:hypothetical protein